GAGRVGDGHGVVTCAHRAHPSIEDLARKIEHHRERAAQLEAPRVLEELELAADARLPADDRGDRVRLPAPDRRLQDQPQAAIAKGAWLKSFCRSAAAAGVFRISIRDLM